MATPQNALLDQLPETGELTEERFRRMSGASVGEARLPRVAPEGLPAGPRWPALVQTAALRLPTCRHIWCARKLRLCLNWAN